MRLTFRKQDPGPSRRFPFRPTIAHRRYNFRFTSRARTIRVRMHICSPQLVDEWMDLWDKALEYGTLGNTIAQIIFKILSTPIFGDKSCSYCNNIISESSFLDHMVLYHGLDQNTLFSSIATNKAALFKPPLSKCILKLVFHSYTSYVRIYIISPRATVKAKPGVKQV